MFKKYTKLKRIIQEKGIAKGAVVLGKLVIDRIIVTGENLFLLCLKVFSKDGLVLREIQGNKMYLDPSDIGLSRTLLLKGRREELVGKVIREEVKRGMTVIDIGANLGYYALLEAFLVGEEGTVYALEPVPGNFDILIKNVEVNGYKNTKVYPLAVSSKSGTSEIALTAASNCGSMLDLKKETVSKYMKEKMSILIKNRIEIDTVSLDDFLDKEGIRKVNLIRMDIEGYEIEAVKGMTNTLKNMPSPLKLLFEIHNNAFSDAKAVIAPMLEGLFSFGFKPKYIILDKEILSNLNKEDFIERFCSYKDICPHVFLEK